MDPAASELQPFSSMPCNGICKCLSSVQLTHIECLFYLVLGEEELFLCHQGPYSQIGGDQHFLDGSYRVGMLENVEVVFY
jgi:hypothetical protein